MNEIAKVNLDKHEDERGVLIVSENIPFDVKRVFYVYMKPGKMRGQHANRSSEMLVFCQMGEVMVWAEQGGRRERIFLRDTENRMLYVPPMTWIKYKAVSNGALMLVLCSEVYREEDYIREYGEYEDALQSIG